MYETLRDALLAEEPVALATVVEVTAEGTAGPGGRPEGTAGPGGRPEGTDGDDAPEPALGAKLLVRPDVPPLGSLGDEALDRVVARDALGALVAARTDTRHYGRHGEARQRAVTVFIEAFAPPPNMVIFGAVDFTAALARVAKLLGYRVTVCDARAVFATKARFPMADEVVVDWPDRHLTKVGSGLGPRDAVCVLTHDPKFDVPALMAALATRAGYVGAMGSRRTHAERVERLREAGATQEDLARVMSPVGLDIGARTPEETAISVAAEIIGLRTGRQPPSLRDGEGPIHPRESTARIEARAGTD